MINAIKFKLATNVLNLKGVTDIFRGLLDTNELIATLTLIHQRLINPR